MGRARMLPTPPSGGPWHPAPLRYVGVRPIDSAPVDGPPSSAHSGRNRGGRTIGPALRAGRAIARIPENQLAAAPPFPHFHMTLSQMTNLVSSAVSGATTLYGSGLARPGLGWSRRALRLRVRWRSHWRRLAVVAASRSGADGTDRSIRNHPRVCLTTWFAGFRLLGCPARVLPSTLPSPGWQEVPCPTSERSASHGWAGS